ncbi:MAG: DNA-binding protein [Deltaproteobacteria bacterium]|nr:DNA-binding protein [Deltaproteobacteria bacterium]
MEYQSGTPGRVFYARFDDGDDLLEGITRIVREEQIHCAWLQIIGGLRNAGVVTGPKEPVMPPEPVWQHVGTVREVIGVGSVFWSEGEPLIHLHAALGHHGETLTGCVRKDTKVYLVIEAMIVELAGIDVTRPWFAKGGFNRPTFSSRQEKDEQ